ncbi:MAG: 50S ribosomal protein L10 [Clostridia bacterium]
MPNNNVLESKKQIVSDLATKMQTSAAGVLVDYKGITVEDDTILRREMREAGVEYTVVKNTLVRFAANQIGFEAFDEHLHGTTALAVCATDPIAPARILCKYAKTHENFKIKIGFMDGKIMSAEEVIAIANLPSKETLLSQVLYGFNAPITKLAIALTEIAKQKEAQEA